MALGLVQVDAEPAGQQGGVRCARQFGDAFGACPTGQIHRAPHASDGGDVGKALLLDELAPDRHRDDRGEPETMVGRGACAQAPQLRIVGGARRQLLGPVQGQPGAFPRALADDDLVVVANQDRGVFAKPGAQPRGHPRFVRDVHIRDERQAVVVLSLGGQGDGETVKLPRRIDARARGQAVEIGLGVPGQG